MEKNNGNEAHWISEYWRSDEDSCYLAKCSNCGYTEHVFANWYVHSRWHYCPNCGAKITGEEKGKQ